MKWFKRGFMFCAGWQMGKIIICVIDRVIDRVILWVAKKYAPEVYYKSVKHVNNLDDAAEPFVTKWKTEKQEPKEEVKKNPIGFQVGGVA